MMKVHIITAIILLFISPLFSQQVPDFTVTDSEGTIHELYKDYLNKGKTVFIKIFFVDCPPCNAVAKDVQELNEQWGDGNYDVEFFDLSTKSSDNDDKVNGYKNEHGLSFPSIGGDGGSVEAAAPYRSGDFGNYWGTPTYAVVAPDGTVPYMGTNLEAASNAIADTGAEGGDSNEVEPTTYQFAFVDPNGNEITNPEVQLIIKDAMNSNSPSYNIDLANGNSINFIDFETQFPGIANPIFEFSSNANNYLDGVTAIDLLLIQKHILALDPFEVDYKLLAADANGDTNVSALDIVIFRKLILGLITELDTGIYNFQPTQIDIDLDPGQVSQRQITLIKKGNIN